MISDLFHGGLTSPNHLGNIKWEVEMIHRPDQNFNRGRWTSTSRGPSRVSAMQKIMLLCAISFVALGCSAGTTGQEDSSVGTSGNQHEPVTRTYDVKEQATDPPEAFLITNPADGAEIRPGEPFEVVVKVDVERMEQLPTTVTITQWDLDKQIIAGQKIAELTEQPTDGHYEYRAEYVASDRPGLYKIQAEATDAIATAEGEPPKFVKTGSHNIQIRVKPES